MRQAGGGIGPPPSLNESEVVQMRPTPEVVSGLRNTRQALAEQGVKVGMYARFRGMLADKIAVGREKRLAKDNVRNVIFVSAYGNHRIQITAPRDVTLADGTKVQSKPLVAQFKNCIFDVGKQLRHLEDADVEKVVERLRKHPRYGVGLDFWEQADAIDEAKVRKMAAVAQQMEEDPVVKEAVLDYITANEFEKDVKVAASATPADGGGEDDGEDEDEAADNTPLLDAASAPADTERTRGTGRRVPKAAKPARKRTAAN